MKKVPQRTCIVCGDKITKKELIRIVRNKEGKVFYDPTGRANGRGAYICNKQECKEGLLKKNMLKRAFKVNISDEVIEEIRSELLNEKR